MPFYNRPRPEGGTLLFAWSRHCGKEETSRILGAQLEDEPAAVFDFLRDDFKALESKSDGVVGTSFRTFPSFPQRYIERLTEQLPCESDSEGVNVEPLRAPQQPTVFSADDLHIRQFTKDTSRRMIRKGAFRAA